MQVGDIFRLVTEPETTALSSGSSVTRFRVAYNQRARKGSDAEEVVWWIRCSVFGAQGGIAQSYLRKGSQVMLTGNLEMGTYQHPKTNKEEVSYDLFVQSLTLVGNKSDASGENVVQPTAAAARTASSKKVAVPAFGDSDPF